MKIRKIIDVIRLIWATRIYRNRRVIIIDEYTDWLGEVEL